LIVERVELVDELNWLRTSSEMALAANVHRGSGTPVIEPSEFNPYQRKRNPAPPVSESAVQQFARMLNG
jgi:hypothetical protein